MSRPVLVDAIRSPIGRAFKGSLVDVRPDDLVGAVIAALLERSPAVRPESIEEVIVGAATVAGEQGKGLGRIAATLAGLPDSVPGVTVSRACASSLQAIRMAAHAVHAGEGDIFVAAGVESVSRTAVKGAVIEDGNPRFTDPSRPDYVNDMYIPMGQTAENVAERFGITRERMDEFAKLSQDRAAAAIDQGVFEREIVPVEAGGRAVTTDDSPRRGVTLESLSTLKPAFRENGSVTAGNSCPLNDGAAAVLVMSEERAASLGLRPRARILASAVSGLAPEIMGVGPIDACDKVLKRAGLIIGDVDVVELNEAFAAQVLAVCDAVGISVEDQLNPHGGAIALGHPFGMTGARIMTTLLNDLETRDASIGLETMCVGGGQGVAMLIERLN